MGVGRSPRDSDPSGCSKIQKKKWTEREDRGESSSLNRLDVDGGHERPIDRFVCVVWVGGKKGLKLIRVQSNKRGPLQRKGLRPPNMRNKRALF